LRHAILSFGRPLLISVPVARSALHASWGGIAGRNIAAGGGGAALRHAILSFGRPLLISVPVARSALHASWGGLAGGNIAPRRGGAALRHAILGFGRPLLFFVPVAPFLPPSFHHKRQGSRRLPYAFLKRPGS